MLEAECYQLSSNEAKSWAWPHPHHWRWDLPGSGACDLEQPLHAV